MAVVAVSRVRDGSRSSYCSERLASSCSIGLACVILRPSLICPVALCPISSCCGCFRTSYLLAVFGCSCCVCSQECIARLGSSSLSEELEGFQTTVGCRKSGQALELKQDKLIGELRKLHGKDEELTGMVRTNIKKVGGDRARAY